MVEMNAQVKIVNNSPAIEMGAQVKIAYISMRRDINIGSKFYSELHLGRMECMGNLLRNLWRGNPRKIQINNATTIVWWQ